MSADAVAGGESAGELLRRAAALVPAEHYALAALAVLTVLGYQFLELHLLGDLLRGFRGGRVDLVFHPASEIYHCVAFKCRSLHGRYLATPWLASPHLQTLFLGISGRPPSFTYKRQLYTVRDGGTVALDWLLASDLEGADAIISEDASTPLVVLVPGLTSDSDAAYVKHLVHSMARKGWNVVVSNHRGLGGVSITAAVQCILPKEWEGVYFGGLGKAVMYMDLDCRFDVLRLAHILRKRINQACGSAHPTSEEFASKDKFHSFDDTLFSDCMKRFLYVRCYNSSELIAALKSLNSQYEARSKVLGTGIYFLMLDSIGAFYWIDRAPQPTTESKGKTISFQSITENFVQEIRKFLQLQPVLVLVTKAPIYGEGITTSNDFQRGSSKHMLEDSTASRYLKREEEKNGSSRDYMPSAWQTLVTHRITLQDLAQEAGLSSDQDNEVLSLHTSEWVQPFLNTKEKFYIKDDGVGLIQ